MAPLTGWLAERFFPDAVRGSDGRRSASVHTRWPVVIAGCVGLFLLTASGCGGRPDPEVVRAFQEAQRVFDQAESPRDYLRAAGLYQEIREAGVRSAAVLYNQGNAYLRAGRRGEALACYRQAERYRPRDPRLRANLRFALGGEAAARTTSWLERVLFWQNWLSYREKFALTSMLVGLAFLLGVLALARPRSSLWWRLALAALVLIIPAGGSAAYDAWRFEVQRHGVLIEDQVTARMGDGENYEPAFQQPLPEATELRVLQQRNLWLLVEVPGGQQGWIRADAAVVY